MNREYKGRLPVIRAMRKRWALFCMIIAFIGICIISISFYIRHLEKAFLDNIEFYMSEIADHDMKSVDQEIQNQWTRLETIGKKLELEQYQSKTELQHFLNLETVATGFENLTLIDENGISYGANYLIQDVKGEAWAKQLLETKKQFVMRGQSRSNYIILHNKLLYGVPIAPVQVGDVTFVGIVGEYLVNSVKDSLLAKFFDGEGIAQVVGLDGTVITTDIKQSDDALDNLLIQFDDEETKDEIEKKLAAGENFYTIYEHEGSQYIMSGKSLSNVDWMLVVTVPYSVASSQTAVILKMTVYLLTFLCVVIGVVFLFSFVSYKRTMILKNSKEIFYRERLFNLLTSHTDDVFIIENAVTGKLNFVSENMERILGAADQPSEEAMAAMLEEPSRSEFLCKIKELKDAGKLPDSAENGHFEMEMEWTMPNCGKKKWIHLSVYRAIADFMEQEEACLIAVISDYTQVKQNQTELEHAIEKAQEAAKSKSLFLSNMSHEMRTPLNGIVGCIGIMKANLKNLNLLQEYLDKAESTAKYMVSLTNDILDMAKIENHKLTLEECEVSIRGICANMEVMFCSQMKEKEISFAIELEEPLWMIRADKVRIQQIMVNLLSNAQKFTNPGGRVTLQVRQIREKEDRVKTSFTVSDTGIGMSEKFLTQIFQPFEQERLDTARLHGGTGLGMAISYELVQLMHGTIRVTSELGQGSTFVVEFSSLILDRDMENRPEKAESDTSAKLSLQGRKILIAEDNVLNLDILHSILEELGAEVLDAENGQEAVRLFEQSMPGEIDGILMDMQMPVMDGCAAARSIRNMNRTDAKSIPILACTANAFQDDIERVKAAGMNCHMAKPLDIDKVVEQLYKIWEE